MIRIFCLFLCFFLSACSPGLIYKKPNTPEKLGSDSSRANPTYIQWLEKQSMLHQSVNMLSLVAGSSLGWRAPSTWADPESILNQAGVWAEVDPLQLLYTGNSSFKELEKAAPLLSALGVKGLYLSPILENAWNSDRSPSINPYPGATLAFNSLVGTVEEYQDLEKRLARQNIFIGSDLVPPAPGLGPDFFLAERNIREYPSLFMMTEVPRNLWGQLPSTAGSILNYSQKSMLNAAGLLPPAMASDADPSALPGGWAITGEEKGVDGQTRRWIYRFSTSPLSPVLNWDGASGSARRILTASIIQQVGLWGQPLVGFNSLPLRGLDPSPIGIISSTEPEPSALAALAREIRRYGGWSMLRDIHNLEDSAASIEKGWDFVADPITSPALELAMITQNFTKWRAAEDSAFATPMLMQHRLWRSSPNSKGLILSADDYDLLKPWIDEWQVVAPVQNVAPRPVGNGENALPTHFGLRQWSVNATLVAAISNGLYPEELLNPLPKATQELVKKAHVMQLAARALRPGLWVLQGTDIAGALFAQGAAALNLNPGLGGYSFTNNASRSTQTGMPKSQVAYTLPAVQQDFHNDIMKLVQLREKTQVALGSALERPLVSQGSFMTSLTALPNGKDALLLVLNASNKTADSNIFLSYAPSYIRNASTQEALASGNVLQVNLGPWGYKAFIVEHRASSPGKGHAASIGVNPQ